MLINRIIYLLMMVFVTSCGIHTNANPQPIQKKPTKVIAHRGFSGIAPENTLIAFQKAIDTNADYFELDVHRSKDGIPIVIHDNSVKRTASTKQESKVSQMTLNEINKITVGYPSKFKKQFSDQKIPTLKEALQLAKGKIKVCIEIKAREVEEQVLQVVNELKMNDDVIIFSFKYEVLHKIRTLDQNIPILYLIDNANFGTIGYAKLINANAIGVGYGTNPSKELIDKANKEGIEIWKWTVNKEEQMKSLMEIGLDGIITNFPDKALSIKNKN